MTEKNKILVGKIVAPQGIRGEFRLQTYTAVSAALCDLSVFCSRFGAGAFHFVRAIPASSVIVARIDGIDNRNDAELLRGTELFINRDELPALADGEYYQADLIGMHVIRDGTEIGIVDDIQNYGAGDILELDNGEMVAFRGADVDLIKKIITVR